MKKLLILFGMILAFTPKVYSEPSTNYMFAYDGAFTKSYIEELGALKVEGYNILCLQNIAIQITDTKNAVSYLVDYYFYDENDTESGHSSKKSYKIVLAVPAGDTPEEATTYYNGYLNVLKTMRTINTSHLLKKLERASEKMSLTTVAEPVE